MIGHKGGRAYRCHVNGSRAHSSLAPRAVNAIEIAAELIVFIRRLAATCAQRPAGCGIRRAHSTISTGLIEGGTAINIVPGSCSLHLRVPQPDRGRPGSDRARHRRTTPTTCSCRRCGPVHPACAIEFEPIYEYPAHAIDAGHPFVTRMNRRSAPTATPRSRTAPKPACSSATSASRRSSAAPATSPSRTGRTSTSNRRSSTPATEPWHACCSDGDRRRRDRSASTDTWRQASGVGEAPSRPLTARDWSSTIPGHAELIPAALAFDTSKTRAKRRHQPPPRPLAQDTRGPLPGPLVDSDSGRIRVAEYAKPERR